MRANKIGKATPRPWKWLCQGGGGHEDGEDGIRAMTLSGEALVETLEAYREDLGYDRLLRRDKLARELVERLLRSPYYKILHPQARQLLKLYEEEK